MKEHISFECNYISHKSNNSNSLELYYCNSCNAFLCSQCLREHNTKNENSNHKTELLTKNNLLAITDKKRKELEEKPFMNNKSIINLNSNEKDKFMDNKVVQYMNLCNELNNYYRNRCSEFWNKFLELEKLKENFRNKIDKNPILLLRDKPQDIEIINKIYEDLIQKEKNINYLFNSTSNLLNEDNIKNNILNCKFEIIDNGKFTFPSISNSNLKLSKSIIVSREKEENQNKENIFDINNTKGAIKFNSNNTEIKNEMEKKNVSTRKPMFVIFPLTNINDKNLIKNSNKNLNKNNIEEKNIKANEIQENKNIIEEKKYLNSNIEKYNSNKNNNNANQNKKKIEDDNKNIINKDENFLNKYSNKYSNLNQDGKLLSLKTERQKSKDSFQDKNFFNYSNKIPKLENNNSNKLYPNNLFTVSKSKIIPDYEEKKNNTDSNINSSIKELLPNFMSNPKSEGINTFGKKLQNFLMNDNKINSPKTQKFHLYQHRDLLNHTKYTDEVNSGSKDINQNLLNKNKNYHNDLNEIKYLFGLSTYLKKFEKRLVVFEMKSKYNIAIKYIKSSDIVHTKEFLYSSNFPYPHCRLINKNNIAYVIGGDRQDDLSDLGNNFCFKIYYKINEKDSSLDKVICSQMKFTNYRHKSHCLLYSNNHKTIFVLSGHNQRKCEYTKVDEKDCITKWEELIPLREAREDCLGFLFNEQYIFLIGGNKFNNNNNYDMFDISSLYENRRPMWKNYIIQYNYINRNLFDSKGSGVIEYKSNIYILGGYNIRKEVSSWKISFSIFKDEVSISKIESFEMNSSENNSSGNSFLGDQRFINFGNYYFNIACGGICKYISKKILDKRD